MTAAIAVLTTVVAGRFVPDFPVLALPPLAPASDTTTMRAARAPATAGSLAMNLLPTAVQMVDVESDMAAAFAAMTTAAAGRLDLDFLPPAVRQAADSSAPAAIAVLDFPLPDFLFQAAALDPTATAAPPIAVAADLAADVAFS